MRKTKVIGFGCAAIIILVLSLSQPACNQGARLPENIQAIMAGLPEKVDYNLHIKPILSDRCFKCHGPDKNKVEAGLQLTSFEGATTRLESGKAAIDPGSPSSSELVRRILSTDPDEMMPAPQSHLSLSDEEKALLIKWVDQGARYKEHWSLTPLIEQEVPSVGGSIWTRWGWTQDEETRWVKNEIDHFVLAKLKELKLKPGKEADRSTLLRRVYMDLTGLPPSPQEVEAFLKDRSPDAYEKIVDRLLGSVHFGEQQAVSWLDLARYADSHGYQDDGLRTAWPYRDWVINAFNKNLPFDQFITWQLAGDLLPNPNKDMLIATSFNRQHPQTQEGGVVDEEYQTEYVADRTNTFGKAMLGLTFECARCHDHKYDPISQKDYYSLFAFFNQNRESGVVPYLGEASPTLLLPTAEQEKVLNYLKGQERQLEKALDPWRYQKDFEQWRQGNDLLASVMLDRDKGLLAKISFDPVSKGNKKIVNEGDRTYTANMWGEDSRLPTLVDGAKGKGWLLQGDYGLRIQQEGVDFANGKDIPIKNRWEKGLNFERNQPFSIGIRVKPMKKGIKGAILQRANTLFEGDRGYSINMNADGSFSVVIAHTWPGNCVEVRSTDALRTGEWKSVFFTYDGSSRANGIRLFVNGSPARTTLITDALTKSILKGPQNKDYSYQSFTVGSSGENRKNITDIAVDELLIYDRPLSTLEVLAAVKGEDAMKQAAVKNEALLREFYLLHIDKHYSKGLKALQDLRKKQADESNDLTEVMVMQELPVSQQRKTHLLNRGVYDAPGEEVSAETPLKIGALPSTYPRNRLGLAKWLLDKKNPLFARVMANRLWLQFFGRGLVKTQEDFGNQGELPSHPELLDWLAVQYRKDKWDTKRFIKRIVLSATYRQSSVANEKQIEADPDNKWLARGASYRYSAEQVRDNILATSGLLVRKIGGPSVYPYQPSGIWEAMATRNLVSYVQQHGDSLYRRSMYTIWKRSSPPPMMLNFDSPDRSGCTVRRQKTATPLQALVTLNDPQFVEAARVLAQVTVKRNRSTKAIIHQFFLTSISRAPRALELQLMTALYEEELERFRKEPSRAAGLLDVGEYPVDASIPQAELAAYSIVAATLFNHDEAIVKR